MTGLSACVRGHHFANVSAAIGQAYYQQRSDRLPIYYDRQFKLINWLCTAKPQSFGSVGFV